MTTVDRQQINFKGNAKHLEILLDALEQKKIRIWNEWRMDNSSELPNLQGVNLIGAKLTGVDFIGVDLSEADLSKADLSSSDLSGIILARATLVETRFIHSTIYGGGLGKANLQNANLDGAVLNSATLSQANLTGAIIRGISYTGWNIENIKCDYVFTDTNGKMREPKDRDFEPGEFEKLYKDLPKIEYTFLDDFTVIDIIVMDQIVQEINIQHPGHELKLDSFNHRGRPRAVFTIRDRKQTDTILGEIETKYKTNIKALEGKIKDIEKHFALVTKHPQIIYDIGNMYIGDAYNINGPTGAVGPQANAYDINFNQLWGEVSSEIDLPKLAEDLLQLRQELKEKAKEDEHYRAIAEVEEAEIAAKEGKGPKALEHLKNAGKWTFSVAEKIGTSLATAALKTALGL